MPPRMPQSSLTSGYSYHDALPGHTYVYLWPAVFGILDSLFGERRERRVFDLGCGNGAFAAALAAREYDVVGVDPSEEGVREANRAYARLKVNVGSAYDDLRARYGQFPAVVSLEVVEHVYAPRTYAACLFDLVEKGGVAIVSTPYHGYLKNLALAITGRMDAHFTALWDHGHIKFWSIKTLGALLREAGFRDVAFRRVGRIPAVAKSMIAIARK
jgi:2-polyprenyl-3-methyl-5-hydroxy-6-metoxy-1,4-benzoquinol methylase